MISFNRQWLILIIFDYDPVYKYDGEDEGEKCHG